MNVNNFALDLNKGSIEHYQNKDSKGSWGPGL